MKRISEYMIEVRLYFRQLELVIIGVYIPPNDKLISKKIQQKIVEIITNRKRHTEIVILGDFNHTVDNILDRQHPQTTSYKRLPIFNWLKRQDFADSYRSLHPKEKMYTWSNHEAATRIDYIWLSETLASGLQKATIEEAENLTDSDHKILITEIWVGHVIANQSCAEVKRKDQTRTIYLYKEAKQEN